MTNLDRVMSEEDTEVNNKPETSPEQSEAENSTNTSTVEETSPEAPQNEKEDKPEEPEQKVDKSQLTDMQKAEYSFRKQLGKQKARYESQLAEQKKAFDDLQSRLDKLENPDKYKEKLRDSFQTDDEYIDYIVSQRMQKYFDQQNEESKKIQMQNAEDERNQAAINDNIAECFKTEEEQKDYYNTVKAAFDNGLEALMDKEGMIANYILKSPTGPKIMYELAKNPESVKRIYSQRDPQSRFFEMKMLERELMTKPAEVKVNPNLAKPVGTPGLAKGNTKDMFEDKDDLRSFIRKR